jgi:hypothetical protein
MVRLDVPRLSFGEQVRECPGTKYYCEEIRVFKAGVCLNTLAWNNKIGLWSYFVGLRTKVMINRDSWGH